MKSDVFLLLGSNQGDKALNIDRAISHLQAIPCTIMKSSHLYETAAWGKNDQDSFFNQVIQIETSLDSYTLLQKILAIEQQIGRVRTEKWGPRIIDIDILFFGSDIIKSSELVVPHPGIAVRRFTLEPLCEIAPDFMHPQLRKTVRELRDQCTDPLEVRPLK